MKKTVLHVGLHKTATTFLQKSVWPNVDKFTYLTRPYTQHNRAFNKMQYADDSVYNKEEVIEELRRINATQLLLSDESFSGKPVFFSYINRSLIARRLKELFPTADIIVFLRDQRDICLSHYSSYIKMPYGTKRISQLFHKPREGYGVEPEVRGAHNYTSRDLYYNNTDYFIHLDGFLYSTLIRLYSELFEKCHFFLYEDLVRDAQGTFERLSDILGNRVEGNAQEVHNTSLKSSDLRTQRVVNKLRFIGAPRLFIHVAKQILRLSPARGESNKVAVNALIGDYYHVDNAKLKAALPSLRWDLHPGKYPTG